MFHEARNGSVFVSSALILNAISEMLSSHWVDFSTDKTTHHSIDESLSKTIFIFSSEEKSDFWDLFNLSSEKKSLISDK